MIKIVATSLFSIRTSITCVGFLRRGSAYGSSVVHHDTERAGRLTTRCRGSSNVDPCRTFSGVVFKEKRWHAFPSVDAGATLRPITIVPTHWQISIPLQHQRVPPLTHVAVSQVWQAAIKEALEITPIALVCFLVLAGCGGHGARPHLQKTRRTLEYHLESIEI